MSAVPTQYTTKHFTTGKFKSHATFVSDEDYSMLLDNVVKATVDMFIRRPVKIDDGRDTRYEILLGKRMGLPHNDWFIPGGRLMPGEVLHEGAARVLKRELGLGDIFTGEDESHKEELPPVVCVGKEVTTHVPHHRLKTLTNFTFSWDTRTQAPLDHGTSDASLCVSVDLTQQEAEAVVLDTKEYETLVWVDPAVLLDYILPIGHPMLKKAARVMPDSVEYVQSQRERLRTEAKMNPAGETHLHSAVVAGIEALLARDAWNMVEAVLPHVETTSSSSSSSLGASPLPDDDASAASSSSSTASLIKEQVASMSTEEKDSIIEALLEFRHATA